LTLTLTLLLACLLRFAALPDTVALLEEAAAIAAAADAHRVTGQVEEARAEL
jgi:hypothetical protein